MKFAEIPQRLNPLLHPPDPIVINHVISVEGTYLHCKLLQLVNSGQIQLYRNLFKRYSFNQVQRQSKLRVTTLTLKSTIL